MKARAWAKKPPPSHVEAWVEEWRRVRGRREASSDDPSPLFRPVPVPVPALPCVSRVCRESALARRCRGVRISRRVWVSRRVGVESVGVESVWVSRAWGLESRRGCRTRARERGYERGAREQGGEAGGSQ